MEQQLDATYLRPCFVSKAFALSVAAIGIGTSIDWLPMGSHFFGDKHQYQRPLIFASRIPRRFGARETVHGPAGDFKYLSASTQQSA